MSCRHDHRINRGKGCKIVFRQQVTKLGYLPSFSQFFQTFASENLVKPAVALSGAHCCVNALSLKDSSVATRRRVNLGLPRSGESAGLVCLCAFGRSEYALATATRPASLVEARMVSQMAARDLTAHRGGRNSFVV